MQTIVVNNEVECAWVARKGRLRRKRKCYVQTAIWVEGAEKEEAEEEEHSRCSWFNWTTKARHLFGKLI